MTNSQKKIIEDYLNGNAAKTLLLEGEALYFASQKDLAQLAIVGAKILAVVADDNGTKTFYSDTSGNIIVNDNGDFFKILDDDKILFIAAMIKSELKRFAPEWFFCEETYETTAELVVEILQRADEAALRKGKNFVAQTKKAG